MRTQILALLLGTVLAAWGSASAAGDLVVICHPSVSLKADDVRDVYLGEVMKLDAKKYAGVWIKKAFRDGSAPPPLKASDAEAIAYVKQTAGGCSYVTSAPGDGVIVVAKF
jgi:hypothetical protein